MSDPKLSIKYWAEEDRPREKLLLRGKSNLSSAELLAIIIGGGYRNVSALHLAKKILASRENKLTLLGRCGVGDLTKFKGIGTVKALAIVAALELGRRRDVADQDKVISISSSEKAYTFLKPELNALNHEVFKILLLNRNNRLIRLETISVGGVSGTVVDPKIIFKKALDYNSSSIILAHNHPSGHLKPSQADIDITHKLIKAGQNLDIKILDHLIIGNNDYFSFADANMI